MAANNVVVTRNDVVNRLANRALNSYDLPEYEINSGDISLTYFPNSVFIYVKQSEGERFDSFESRHIETDSYTKDHRHQCDFPQQHHHWTVSQG